jgi:hypothetical protein
MEEILLELLLADAIRGFAAEFGEHANRTGVGLLGALAFAIELQSLNRVLIPVFHDRTSPLFGVKV